MAKFLLCLLLIIFYSTTALASPKGTILFIPHDDRPTSGPISAEAVEMAGYKVMMPDESMLGGLYKQGNTDALWEWTEKMAAKADAIVLSADSIIYGGLVASRKHELTEDILSERVSRLASLHQQHPNLKLYAFSSLMRTPKDGRYSGNEEPEYYLKYGGEIFQTTALEDKAESLSLNNAEKAQLQQLKQSIPSEVWADWTSRRAKNLKITKDLINYTREGILDYYVIGKDDNAPLSATHREARELQKLAEDIPASRLQLLSGIDEFAMLLLARAINRNEAISPKVYVQYNQGTGGDTIPAFSDEKISCSIDKQIMIAGAKQVSNADEANYVLLVNTDYSGLTGDGDSVAEMPPDGTMRPGVKEFAASVAAAVDQGYKTGVADISFANGADNALMEELKTRRLLFKIRNYAGWNTPTNSTGFAIGQGLVAIRLPLDSCDRLLMERYLDDWVYQSNVRTELMKQLGWLRKDGYILNLGEYEQASEERATALLQEFVIHNLPPFPGLAGATIDFPWHNTFIGGIHLPLK